MPPLKHVKDTNDWIVVGRFGRVHGIKGFITIHSFTDPRENILHYSDWHMLVDKQWRPLELLQVEVNHKSIVALVKNYEQRELASKLTNIEIAVRRDCLPEAAPGEYYWHDLVGMTVVDLDGKSIGSVTDIMPTGANDVLVVEGDTRHLIPFLIDRVVIDINLDQRLIKVDWDLDF